MNGVKFRFKYSLQNPSREIRSKGGLALKEYSIITVIGLILRVISPYYVISNAVRVGRF